ncbi:5-(carboxyamino)imidazole ribonucleotide synthase [Fulvivirga sedimenti]|uniref:N5-carboxyaminoimidazole ribonucleotide synthase n=1 Tax=Fulvivirga sedimenti TaxID=2879465 RepID=A0A9X1HVM0_9BACT|nr:5-(carboxyamino)imidazole ribonucleotide synthase [Fulvivirga sedimenti]MCA6078491.1 5-(carboxyamino)imidazole ribonucleotide synthase [Fulvivirga sedimenti]
MKENNIQDLKLGILGGGQLGRMFIQSAMDYNIDVHILDPDPDAPCKNVATSFTVGKLTDYDTVMKFGKDCDILTIEIENVNTEALRALEKEGVRVFPQPDIIELIKDKRTQKSFYRDHDIPTADFTLVDSKTDIAKLGKFPSVNKLGKEGYDGRGVQVLRTASDIDKAFDVPGLIEDLVDFEKELAVIVARNERGECRTFPVVEMVFHPEANLVEYLFAPADVSAEIAKKADEIARNVIDRLGMVGLLAVEMFLTRDGDILVNEVAPRPHNSGHQTIEGNITSQYEQHLRSIFNLPLGDTSSRAKAAMVNLLGEEGHTGPAFYEGLEKVSAISGVHVHLYGKKLTKPFRKMGHVTIEENDMELLIEKVQFVKEHLKVISNV